MVQIHNHVNLDHWFLLPGQFRRNFMYPFTPLFGNACVVASLHNLQTNSCLPSHRHFTCYTRGEENRTRDLKTKQINWRGLLLPEGSRFLGARCIGRRANLWNNETTIVSPPSARFVVVVRNFFGLLEAYLASKWNVWRWPVLMGRINWRRRGLRNPNPYVFRGREWSWTA